jgi:hypothetical protein
MKNLDFLREDNMSDSFCETSLKATKEHKCFWCKEIIKKDEFYIKIECVFHGNFSIREECIKCNDLIEEYCKSDEYDRLGGLDISELYDWWDKEKCHNCVNYDYDEDYEEDCLIDGKTSGWRCDNLKEEFDND